MNSLFDVTEEAIASTSPQVFTEFVNGLLRAEGYSNGVSQTRIHTTTRIGISDGGVDARVESPIATEWLPQGISVWQFKSGTAPTDAKLRNEFNTTGVQETLASGGVYRLVVSASLNSKQRIRKLKVLQDCCRNIGLDESQIDFWAADKLAEWAKNHTALRLLLGGPIPGGLYRWESWAKMPRFSQPFQPDQLRSDIIAKVRASLANPQGPVRMNIQGLAGVGKTRLGLEVMRAVSGDDGLSDRVLYSESPAHALNDLLYWVSTNPQAKLVLVVDECTGVDAERLSDQAEQSNGRVRLITIGQAQDYSRFDPSRPASYLLDKLSNEAMTNLLKMATPGLSDAGYAFAVSVASGFVKIAVNLVEAMLRHPERVTVRDLALDYKVHDVIKQFLVPDETDRRVMRALALMSRVGWEGELQQEGQVVIKHLGLDWHDAISRVRRLTDEGIIAKQGRYRYVTPHILAVWLAGEVWEDYRDQTIMVLTALPFPTSGQAFLERLRDISDDPRARRVCEMMLSADGLFPTLSILNDEGRSQAFSLLAESHPQAGLSALQRLMDGLPRDDLINFRAGRRQIVWLLEKLAWLPETFIGASRLLLLLANAENETWANNASGVWVDLFGTYLGNTAVPALERHALVAEALDGNTLECKLLAVRAISKIFSIHETGSVTGEQQGGKIAPPRWMPRIIDEDRQVRLSGLLLLDRALASNQEQVRQAALKVLLDHARGLVALRFVDELAVRLEAHIPTEYEERRSILRVLGNVLDFEAQRLTPEQTTRLQKISDTLAGTTYGERLRLWTGDIARRERRGQNIALSDWIEQQAKEREEMSAALADEAVDNPELLQDEWEWLGSASFSYFFAKRLGELDTNQQFWNNIEALVRRGKGYVVASGYLDGQAVTGHDWRAEVLDRWAKQPETALAVLDLTWRAAGDDVDAKRLIALVKRGWLTGSRLGALAFSKVSLNISIKTFLDLITSLLSDPSEEATANAATLLSHRLRIRAEDRDSIAPIVWEILERSNALTSQHDYQIMDMVSSYVADDPVRVTRAVLKIFEEKAPPLLRESPQIHLLEKATGHDPQSVWAEVAPLLTGLREGKGSVALYLCLQGWYGQCVGANVLLAWARNNMPDGPRLVAAMTAVRESPLHLVSRAERIEKALEIGPLDPLARELLIQFPEDEAVGNALAANFTSGTFWGNFSQWLRSHQEIAKTWSVDPSPAVRSWARGMIESIQKQIDVVIVQEEEESF